MKFSIILATINRSECVLNAIISIINQSYKNFEIIIIDQSDDFKTKSLLEEYLNKNELAKNKIIYYKVIFKGLSRARNYGIKKATGDFICLMDDDAEYEENFLNIANDLIRKSKYSMLSGMIIDKNTKKVFMPLMEVYNSKVLEFSDAEICSSASLVINKIKLEEVGLFDERLGAGEYFGAGEEIDLIMRFLEKGYKIKYSRKLIVYHPYPNEKIDDKSIKRAFTYALGEGALNKKCIKNFKNKNFFRIRYFKRVFKSFVAMIIYCFNKNKSLFYKNRLKGLIKGFLEFK